MYGNAVSMRAALPVQIRRQNPDTSHSIAYVQTHQYMMTIMASVDEAVEVSRGRIRYGTLIPKHRGAIEAFISVFVCLPVGTGKAFVNTVRFPS